MTVHQRPHRKWSVSGPATRRRRGTGTVRERSDGRFEARLVVGGQAHAVYRPTREEADDALAELVAAVKPPQPRQRRSYFPNRLTQEEVVRYAVERAITLGLDANGTVRLVVAATRTGRVARGIVGPCHYCGDEFAATVDHVVPLSRGGTDTEGNVVSACWDCNARKSNQLAQPPLGLAG